ncbi:nucleotidyltransferase substrate binding protein [bacterium]|nr:nucleotidyltransferase substrate binding protein [bacterium]
MVNIQDLDLTNFEKALGTLKKALEVKKLSDLERDGAIQRFEYTFEIAWKTMRKVLLALGRSEVSSSPKPIIRDAQEEGLIESAELWFGFLEARNLSTHIYDQAEADFVFGVLKDFPPYVEKLLQKIRKLK